MPNNNRTAEDETETQMKRNCTDFLCLILFGVCFGIMGFIASFAIVYGNPGRILNGYDSFGNVCGSENVQLGDLKNTGLDMRGKRFLFFFNVKDVTNSLKLCVKKCPDRDLRRPLDVQLYARQKGSNLCRYDINVGDYTKSDPLSNNPYVEGWNSVCPMLPIYQSVPILSRCVPKYTNSDREDIIYNVLAYLNSIDMFQKIFSNFYSSWKILLTLIFIAFLTGSFLLLFLIKYSSAKIVAVALVSSSLVTVSLLWWTYVQTKKQLDQTPFVELLDETAWNEHAFLVFSILGTILMVCIWALVLHVWERLKELPRLFSFANECIQDMCLLLLQPAITFISLLIFFAFWVYIVLCMSTASSPSEVYVVSSPVNLTESMFQQRRLAERSLNFTLKKNFSEMVTIEYTNHTWVYHSATLFFCLFLYIWISEFILACQHMVVAGAVVRWYFRRRIKLNSPILKSMRHTVMFHIGSLALGSILVTIFKLPRLLIQFIITRRKNLQPTNVCPSCHRNCTWCESNNWCGRIVEFILTINHNAYVIIVAKETSLSFFAAAQKVYKMEKELYSEKALSVIRGGNCLLFFCKSIVTGFITSAGLLWMKNDPVLHYYALPVFALCISSFFIAHCVLSIYEIIIDTLFLCYHDEKVQTFPMEDECYTSKSFHTFILEMEDENYINGRRREPAAIMV